MSLPTENSQAYAISSTGRYFGGDAAPREAYTAPPQASAPYNPPALEPVYQQPAYTNFPAPTGVYVPQPQQTIVTVQPQDTDPDAKRVPCEEATLCNAPRERWWYAACGVCSWFGGWLCLAGAGFKPVVKKEYREAKHGYFITLLTLIQVAYWAYYYNNAVEECNATFETGFEKEEDRGTTQSIICMLEQQYDYGSAWASGIQQGYIWQLITNTFCHSNLSHLVGNMIVQFGFGYRLEQAIGTSWVIFIYFMTAIFATLSHYSVCLGSPRIHAVLMGASGADFGILGACLGYILTFWSVLKPDVRRRRALTIIALTFAFELFTWLVLPHIWSVAKSNTANMAHLGGFVSGFLLVISATWFPKLGKQNEELRSFFGMSHLVTRVVGLALLLIPVIIGSVAIGSADHYESLKEFLDSQLK